MSDPAKNAEVEDVLSSIRRLVSEDKRPLQTPKPKPEVPSDRLVLTPALRVEALPDAETTRALDADVADEAAQASADPDQAQDVVRKLEDDYSDDPYNFADDADVDGERGETTVRLEDGSEDAAARLASQDSDRPAALSAKIAQLENAVGEISDNFEPDGISEDDNAGTDQPAMAWEDLETSEDEPDVPLELAFVHRVPADSAGEPEEGAVAKPDDAEEAELFAADGEERSGRDVEADANTASDAAPDDGEKAGEAAGFAFVPDEQTLDEDALRELITEIVHDELQGALGERITRNVRRLVRREIHRALTARELD